MEENIQIVKNKIQWEKLIIWLFCITCLLFLIIQHRAVFLHYDDFGYGSLSYGYNGNNHGMFWTIGDLIAFLKYHYMSWGGRILFFSFFTSALKIGEPFIQLLQSLVIWGICLSIYALIRRHRYDWIAAVLTILVLGSVGRAEVVAGFFWYAASCLYVWPFLPFLTGILLLKKGREMRGNMIASSILFFIAGFSQEQVAVLVSVTLVGNLILMTLLVKRPTKIFYVTTAAGVLGAAIEFFAPGNFVRAAAYPDFNFFTLLKKAGQTTFVIIYKLFDYSNLVAIILWIVVLQFLGVSLIRFNNRFHYLGIFNALSSIGFLSAWLLTIPLTVRICICFCFSMLLIVEIIVYFFIRKDTISLAMLAGALSSLGMMILAPSFEGRCAVPFFITFNLLAIDVLREEVLQFRMVKMIRFVPIFLFVVALINVFYITNGLFRNKTVNMINHTKLREYSRLSLLGETAPSILLYRVPDDNFTVNMPYWPGNERIDDWIRCYYGLPNETRLIYRSLDRPSNNYEAVVNRTPEIASVWPETIDLHASPKEEGTYLLVTPSYYSYYFTIVVNGNSQDTYYENGYLKTYLSRDLISKNMTVWLCDSLSGECSEKWNIPVKNPPDAD